jgi:phosphoribosylformimino-5-aminoimidazole carboxamide ribotide isomerase
MEIIPVIDLKGGHVVRARGGDRAHYAPIETPLAGTSRPHDIVAGFLALYPFRKIYIADLDAITGRGDQSAMIAALEVDFSGIEFWVDSGIATDDTATAWLARHRGALVVGSESLNDLKAAPRLVDAPRRVLSLDFRGADFSGPADLATNSALWPRRVIAMTLAKVGAGTGPDLQRLRSIRHLGQERLDLYAAGGVRDGNDLRRLAGLGIAGTLVASALHAGTITATVLREFETPK